MTEYSSMKFAWFFLAEYINMINVSAIATTLFLGGWRAPWPLSAINDGMLNTGWWPVLWFLAKMWLFMFLFVWVRGTLLRLRYDQFMKLGWKVLIPAALAWVVMVAVVQGIRQFVDVDLTTLIIGLAIAMVVVIGLSFLIPDKAPQPAPELTRGGEFDPFAGGYPVPPLPGQQLPPSPRRLARAAAATAGGGGSAALATTPTPTTAATSGTGATTGRAPGTDHDSDDTEVERG
jgi:NADH-quinone oxidoreductase subunit H